jgi:hypothetical protein
LSAQSRESGKTGHNPRVDTARSFRDDLPVPGGWD